MRARRRRAPARRPTPTPTATAAPTPCATCSSQRRRAAQPRGARPRPGRRSAAGRAAPRGDLRAPARARRRQGHDDRSLGDDGARRSSALPDLSSGLSRRGDRAVRAAIGRGVLGNCPASGTAIIDELGDEHVRSGRADRLHLGRLGLSGRLPRGHRAGRARSTSGVPIARAHPARPARGRAASSRGRSPACAGGFERTPRRRDFSLPPTGPTYLDLLSEAGVPVIGVGKIGEIFAQRGVEVDDHTHRQHGGSRRLPPPPAGDAPRPAVRQPRRFRPDLGASQRRRRLCGRPARGRRGRPGPSGRARARRRRPLVRRPRRRPDHGEHRPLPRVRSAAGGGPVAAGATTASSRTSGRPPTSA